MSMEVPLFLHFASSNFVLQDIQERFGMCCNRVHTSTSVVYKAKGKKPTLIYVLVLYSVAERGQKVSKVS